MGEDFLIMFKVITVAAITVAIITLANELNMSVLAECVEAEGQLLFLEGHGCNTYQGCFYSRPVPFDALLRDEA